MSSINTYYTFNYSQPSEYRLSHDSVFLARKVYEHLSGVDLNGARALDVCAGSGVVGMDFLFHRRAAGQTVPDGFDFLEVQSVYVGHFQENRKRLGETGSDLNFLNLNYNDLQIDEFAGAYDLIIGNPPYFLTTQGQLSPSEFKNRCRFFIDSDLTNLLLGIEHSLKKNGVCYMILKDLAEHGRSVIDETRKICQNKLKIEIAGDIRGAYFLRIIHV